MANNNLLVPSLALFPSTLKTLEQKDSSKLAKENSFASIKIQDLEKAASIALNESFNNNNLQVNAGDFTHREPRKPSNYTIYIGDSPVRDERRKESGAFIAEPDNIMPHIFEAKLHQPNGDENDDVLPDDPVVIPDGHKLTVPQSIFGKRSSNKKKSTVVEPKPKRTKTLDNKGQSEENKIEREKKSKSQSNIFVRGFNRLKKTLIRASPKKATYLERHESHFELGIERSEIQKGGASFMNLTTCNDPVNKDQEKDIKAQPEQEEEKKMTPDQIKRILAQGGESPVVYNRNKSLYNDHADSLKDQSFSNIEFTDFRAVIPSIQNIQAGLQSKLSLNSKTSQSSPTRFDKRGESFGENSKMTREQTIGQFFKQKNALLLFIKNIVYALCLVLTFVLLAVFSSIIAYPYKEYRKYLWIGQFFHGFFLGCLSFTTLKAAMRTALSKVKREEQEFAPQEKGKKKKENSVLDINMLGCLLIVISGLFMVLFVASVGEKSSNPYVVILLELAILMINTLIFTGYFKARNSHDKKKGNDKPQQGFFSVPIYKHFMSELHRIKMDNFCIKPDDSDFQTSQQNRPTVREEGIDKFKPKCFFEIVTTRKVFASQVLSLITYLQFITVIALAKLYDFLQEHGNPYPASPILIFYPLVMFLFVKIADRINRTAELEMSIYAHYLNAAFSAVFYRIIAFHIIDFSFVWMVIATKAFYKLTIYAIFGIKIDFLQVYVVDKIKPYFKKKTQDKMESILGPISQASIKEPSRIDSLAIKKIKDLEKEASIRQQKMGDALKSFLVKFFTFEFNDILYSIACIALIRCYQFVNLDFLELLLQRKINDNYILAILIELGVNGALLIFVALCWWICKTHKLVSMNSNSSQIMRSVIRDYIIIAVTLLISFLFLLQL